MDELPPKVETSFRKMRFEDFQEHENGPLTKRGADRILAAKKGKTWHGLALALRMSDRHLNNIVNHCAQNSKGRLPMNVNSRTAKRIWDFLEDSEIERHYTLEELGDMAFAIGYQATFRRIV